MAKIIKFPLNKIEETENKTKDEDIKNDILSDIQIKEYQRDSKIKETVGENNKNSKIDLIDIQIKEYQRDNENKKNVAKNNKNTKFDINKVKLILSYLNKFNLNKKKIAIGLLSLILLAGIKFGGNSFITTPSTSQLNFVENLNLNMSKEVLDNYDEEFALTKHSDSKISDGEVLHSVKDINVVVNETVEGDDFALYKVQIKLALDAKNIKIKDGKKTFKFKDVDIKVVDVSADLTDEDMLLLSDDSIDAIAKESSKLTKEIEKKLKKEQDYVCAIIEAQM